MDDLRTFNVPRTLADRVGALLRALHDGAPRRTLTITRQRGTRYDDGTLYARHPRVLDELARALGWQGALPDVIRFPQPVTIQEALDYARREPYASFSPVSTVRLPAPSSLHIPSHFAVEPARFAGYDASRLIIEYSTAAASLAQRLETEAPLHLILATRPPIRLRRVVSIEFI